MAEEDKESKTEEPTAKRLRETREKGRTAKSTEVTTVMVMIAATVFLTFFGMYMINTSLLMWREYFGSAGQFELTAGSTHHLLKMTLIHLFILLMPMMSVIALVGVIANYWQNDGWIFSWSPLALKFNKINPVAGWKKILGKDGIVNLFKSLGKLALIGTAVYLSLDKEWDLIPVLMDSTVVQTLKILGWQTLDLFVKVLLALILIALIDFVYQKYQFTENLKMTKQEIKDERKQEEGDPIIKQRIRQKQFEFFRKRMMADVPSAEVIITNPTHLSIALRYRRLEDPAPVVIAKGAGYVAMKIREIAKEHDIPTVEDKPLARTLFRTVDVGDYVPESMYKAVAQVLAYVYRLKRKVL